MKDQDQDIVDLFWARDEAALKEAERRYGRYCHYIAYSILGDDQDAEEIVNDTFLKAWNTIPPARPEPLRGYLGQMCRQLALDRYQHIHAEKRGGGQMTLVLEELAECLAAPEGDLTGEIALRDVLSRFARSLPKRTRIMFVRRYFYFSPVSDIAREFGMKENSTSALLGRTRQKLKEYLKKEGFDV